MEKINLQNKDTRVLNNKSLSNKNYICAHIYIYFIIFKFYKIKYFLFNFEIL